MTLRPDLLLAHDFGERRQRYDARDAILYALGVGLGGRDEDLPMLYERDLQVLPSFAVTLAAPGMWIREPAFGVTFDQLVHLAQDTVFSAPLPASGEVVGTARVASIGDRGAGRGAELVVERAVRSALDGALHATIRQTLLLRADGGFGGEPPPRPPSTIPDREPDANTSVDVSPRAAVIYRLSGDWNPLHIDPGFASAAGFERPIMHGLGSYAAAGIAVARSLGVSPTSMRCLACRFTGIVHPGDRLDLAIWREPGGAAFVATVRDRKVLDQGWLEYDR